MLDQVQESCVHFGAGPCLVVAGPGSGKTTVLTNRVLNLITEYGIPPEHILVITFTKDAAKEMKKRFMFLCKNSYQAVVFGTFHSIFYQILRQTYHLSEDNILTGSRKLSILRRVLEEEKLLSNLDKDAILELDKGISYVTNMLLDPNGFDGTSLTPADFSKIYHRFDEEKRRRNLYDFDDMLVRTRELFESNPKALAFWQDRFPYVLVDEMQDMNELQFSVLRYLTEKHRNIFAVGDDDQSIYGFRGSDPSIMLHFPEIYEDVTRYYLSTNYRSNQEIVAAAANLISHNKNRFAKDIQANSKEEGKVRFHSCESPLEEASYIREAIEKQLSENSNASIAVLFRTHSQSVQLIGALAEKNISFSMKEGMPTIYSHFIMEDIISYLKIAIGIGERSDFLKILNRPNRHLGRDAIQENPTFENWKEYYRGFPDEYEVVSQFERSAQMMGRLSPVAAIHFLIHGVGYEDFLKGYCRERNMNYEELRNILATCLELSRDFARIKDFIRAVEEAASLPKKETDGTEQVSLYTYHGSKGLEFDTVYLLDVNEGITPSKRAETEEELEEERRMFYVAMTRAKRQLVLLSIKHRYNDELYPSRYLEELSSSASS